MQLGRTLSVKLCFSDNRNLELKFQDFHHSKACKIPCILMYVFAFLTYTFVINFDPYTF